MINYHNKIFRSIDNSASGEVDGQTQFHYRQEGKVIWATYEGGSIQFGTLVAKILADGSLDMRYQHVNTSGAFKTGQCHSIPEILDNGKIRLHESWQWTCGDYEKGQSIIEEV